MVTAVELSSLHPLPRGAGARGDRRPDRQAPLARRASAPPSSACGVSALFSAIRVDEIPTPGGVHAPLRAHRAAAHPRDRVGGRVGHRPGRRRRHRRPRHRRGGLPVAPGQGRARSARALPPGRIPRRAHPDPRGAGRGHQRAGRDRRPERRRAGAHRRGADLVGDTGLPAGQLEKALKLREGSAYRESLARDGARAAEERLRHEGYYEARVTAGPPDWRPDTNRVDLDIRVTAGPRFRVEFEGRSALPESALTSQLTFAVSGAVDAFEQEASAHQLEVAYRERGYHFVERDAARGARRGRPRHPLRHRRGPACDRRVAHVHRQPRGVPPIGSPSRSRHVALGSSGAASSAGTCSSTTSESSWPISARWATPRPRSDPPEVHFSDDRTRARVVIPVSEGPRLTAGGRDHRGRARIHAAEIEAALPFKPGAPWQARQAEDGQRAIETPLRDPRLLRGRRPGRHEPARLDRRRPVRHRRGRADPDRAHPPARAPARPRGSSCGGRCRSGRATSCCPTSCSTGSAASAEFAAFDAVSVDPLRPPPNPFADVEVTLRERKPWHLDFGVGYSNAEGVPRVHRVRPRRRLRHGRQHERPPAPDAGGDSTRWSERTDVLGRVPFVLGSPWWLDVDIFQESSASARLRPLPHRHLGRCPPRPLPPSGSRGSAVTSAIAWSPSAIPTSTRRWRPRTSRPAASSSSA